jgi:Bax protein
MLQQECRTKCRPLAGLSTKLAGVSLLFGILLAGCQQTTPLPPAAPTTATVQIIEPTDLESLHTLFKTHGYDWDRLESGVPPIIVTRFPEDHNHRLPAEEKKRTFLLSLLPMVLLANQAIEAERLEIETLLARHDHHGLLSPAERQRLQEMVDYYKLSGDPLDDSRARALLLHRVDVLPPSLVLAQAATESGWGTSRFAREGNNLFGQRTFRPGNGIVPSNRPDGETHEVKRFGTLFESVRSYMRNLNTHSAYRGLRELRAKVRRNGHPLADVHLASGLEAYSTRSHDYIDDIRAIIRANDLSRTNDTFLRATAPDSTPAFIPTVAELLASQADAAELPARQRLR